MTDACWQDLILPVEIDFPDGGPDVKLGPGDFTAVSSGDVPPGYLPGIRYQVSSLRDHLGIEGTTDPIHYALVPIPSSINGPTAKYPVEITLGSTSPKMLVYVFGSSVDDAEAPKDMKVPPTNPGFMVPEPATIAAVVTPTLTMLAYAIYKRKTS